MDIIPATPDAYDRLIEIWEAAVRATHHFLPEEKIEFYRTRIREQYFDSVEQLDLLVDGGNILGFIGTTTQPEKGTSARIEMLFVDPTWHGRGYGRRLVEHVTARYEPVELEVNEQNPGALDFYRRLGFQVCGRLERDGLGDPFPLLALSNDCSIVLRPETSGDFEAIKDLLIRAFQGHPYSNGQEYRLVELLREEAGLTLALVAEEQGEGGSRVVGHIAFSPTLIDEALPGWFCLGPVAVLPECQNRRIGSRLILAGLEELRLFGADGCVLVGDPDYYHRFGFSCHEGLCVPGVEQRFVLQRSFHGKIPTGVIECHPAFETCSH